MTYFRNHKRFQNEYQSLLCKLVQIITIYNQDAELPILEFGVAIANGGLVMALLLHFNVHCEMFLVRVINHLRSRKISRTVFRL